MFSGFSHRGSRFGQQRAREDHKQTEAKHIWILRDPKSQLVYPTTPPWWSARENTPNKDTTGTFYQLRAKK